MPTEEISGVNNILDVLVASKLAPSKSEARRLVIQGGVSVDGEKIIDPNYIIDKEECVIQKGKKKIVRVIIK